MRFKVAHLAVALASIGLLTGWAGVAPDNWPQFRGPGSETAPGDDNQLQEALRVLGFNPVELSRAP